MKAFSGFILAVVSVLRGETIAQGAFDVKTYVPALGIDARITFAGSGLPVGSGFVAQLWAAPAEEPLSSLRPYLPLLRFGTEEPSIGYVFGPVVFTPDLPPGSDATVVLRAVNGMTWENAECRGESSAFTAAVGGGNYPSPSSAWPSTLSGDLNS